MALIVPSGAVATNLTGEVTSVGGVVTLANAPVIAKVLTGFIPGAGAVSATDSILTAAQKLDGNIATKEATSNKDINNGYAGLSLFKINFKNAANTFTNFFTNATTAARTYTFPDKDITVAGLVDITGTNSGTNTGDETLSSIKTKLGITTLSGDNTGDQTVTLTGAVTGTGTGSFTTTVITNANLTGDVTSVGNATTLANAPVIAKVLTGFSSGAGTITSSDSLLAAIQKLDGNISNTPHQFLLAGM